MVDITVVSGGYKPTYNWGAPSCMGKLNIIMTVTIMMNISTRLNALRF